MKLHFEKCIWASKLGVLFEIGPKILSKLNSAYFWRDSQIDLYFPAFFQLRVVFGPG